MDTFSADSRGPPESVVTREGTTEISVNTKVEDIIR